jgi:NAD(P)-dependent dehydrogenase (short-subunit alcohol dehydrogenase family)
VKISGDMQAVVSGGASGLGRAVAEALAAAGATVTIFDLNEALGGTVAAGIGGRFHRVDVSDPASVAAGLARVEGPLRIAVNCAGIGPAAKTVSRGAAHDPAVFAKTIGVNLIGSFNLASQAAARIAATEAVDGDGARGVIVSTASVAAYDGQIGQVAYAASKGGIVGMTLPMARDLSQYGIRVCTVAPGIFRTPLLDSLPEEVQASLGRQVPFPARLGEASEFAALVLHIVANDMLKGEVIRLDGAIRMAPR